MSNYAVSLCDLHVLMQQQPVAALLFNGIITPQSARWKWTANALTVWP